MEVFSAVRLESPFGVFGRFLGIQIGFAIRPKSFYERFVGVFFVVFRLSGKKVSPRPFFVFILDLFGVLRPRFGLRNT